MGALFICLFFLRCEWRTAAARTPKGQCVLHPELPPSDHFTGNPLEWILFRANTALNANKYASAEHETQNVSARRALSFTPTTTTVRNGAHTRVCVFVFMPQVPVRESYFSKCLTIAAQPPPGTHCRRKRFQKVAPCR